jgi:hypothetical protein
MKPTQFNFEGLPFALDDLRHTVLWGMSRVDFHVVIKSKTRERGRGVGTAISFANFASCVERERRSRRIGAAAGGTGITLGGPPALRA